MASSFLSAMSAAYQNRLAAMYWLFPILQISFRDIDESLCVDAVVCAIRRSFDFGKLPVQQMAEYYAEGVEPRIWDAITVFVPKKKVKEAVRIGTLFQETTDDKYEQRCDRCMRLESSERRCRRESF